MIRQLLRKRRRLDKADDRHGFIMVSIIIVFTALTVIGFALVNATNSQFILANNNIYNDNALLAAEAGIEQSLQQLNSNDNFAGYPSEQQFFNNTSQGRGIYTTTIVNNPSDSNGRIITSTGKAYRYNNSTKPVSTRIVKVTAVGTSSPGYSVQTGPGGLILGGSAAITNSSVYVGGTITLNGASKIGTVSQPLTVNVANQACPPGNNPGSMYPQVCTSTQPISLAQSTNIYGTVCATGQTSAGPNNNIQKGSTGQGLQIGCVAPPTSPPTYDKAGQVAAVTTTAAGNSNTYVCNSWPFDRTWTNNLKLTGNVSVGSSCNITLKGNVYITGNLDLGGASRITVDNSVGGTRPVIIVDGTITVGGSAQLVANSSGTGIQFISFKSSGSCNPNCTSLSGNDLKISSTTQTVSVGGAANLPGMIFQAYWGKIVIGGSGNIGAAAGQTIDMSGAGTITFGTTLSSGNRTWTISSYQAKYPN
jgi:Tfp pilus assembly protein PilX